MNGIKVSLATLAAVSAIGVGVASTGSAEAATVTPAARVPAVSTVLTAAREPAASTVTSQSPAMQVAAMPRQVAQPNNRIRGIYLTLTGCQIAGWAGIVTFRWSVFTCVAEILGTDTWYRLYTDR